MAGLKTLAKELQSKGRYGDTVLAHINPQEAGILKALGGAGTRNPDTGLPEYFKIGNVFKPVQQAAAFVNPFNPGSGLNKGINQIPIVGDVNKAANKLGTQIFQPIEKAIVQPASRGLADFEKQVNKTIPGGYATLGQIALSMIPGGQPYAVALGAAKGSGVMRKGGSFNLQGAVIGGATAYATSELGEYMRGASDTAVAGAPGAMTSADVIAQEGGTYLIPEATGSAVSESGINAATGEMGSGFAGNQFNIPAEYVNTTPPPDLGMQHQIQGAQEGFRSAGQETVGQPNMFSRALNTAQEATRKALEGIQNLGTSTIEGIQNLGTQALELGNKAIDPSTYTEGIPKLLTKSYEGAGDTLSGAKNLLGAGEMTMKEAAKLAAKTGVDPIKMGALAIYGETSLAGLEEQRKYLEESKRANAISQAEYDTALGEINRQRDIASDVVSRNPFNPNPSRDVSIGETFYGRSDEGTNLYDRLQDNLYAMGGQVDDELGGDYSAMGMDQGNMQKGLFGMGYAAGGMPRFLSGGGDGMSDSIKASINGTQEARLADGEFVIPADVVSHLGNGSSKAGAKQLYSMMDKIRKARTGNPKQGKQINPRKYLPA